MLLKVFGFEVPAKLPGVEAKVLNPREAWSDKAAYDATRIKLADMFKNNFTKFVKVSFSILGRKRLRAHMHAREAKTCF